MAIHAGRCSGDGFNFEIGNWMVDDFEVCLKVFVLYLLEKDLKFVFNLLCFVEKVELLTLARFEILIYEFVEQLLELLRACLDWHGVNSKAFVFCVFELNPYVFRYLGLFDFVYFNFFACLHLNNLL